MLYNNRQIGGWGLISNVGQLIKEKREARGLSQKKLGDACGVSDSEIHKIENGTRQNPNWMTLCSIAKALGFHPFEIMLNAGYITEGDIHPALKLQRLDQLSESQLQDVQRYIDFTLQQGQNAAEQGSRR